MPWLINWPLLSGGSDVSNTQAATQPDEQIENWCNAVAAELLVPLEELRPVCNPENDLYKEMQCPARQYEVSTLVSIRRLFDLRVFDQERPWAIYRTELERLKAHSARDRSGGNLNYTLSAGTGKRFVKALIASTLEGQTQFTDAFWMPGIKKTATLI